MRVHACRLTPGRDLADALDQLRQELGLQAGFILTGLGSLSRARVRLPTAAGRPDAFAEWTEPLELVSMAGTLGQDGRHVHLSLARENGACVGGHLVTGCVVRTTVELVVGEASELVFRRRPDPQTGYAELWVTPRTQADR